MAADPQRAGAAATIDAGRVIARPRIGGHEAHLLTCARYVEQNPVRARLVREPREWRWSSARAHLAGSDDGLVSVAPLLALVPDWAEFLRGGLGAEAHAAIRAGERTGRPLGSAAFTARLEKRLGRTLARGKPGPKPKPGAQPA